MNQNPHQMGTDAGGSGFSRRELLRAGLGMGLLAPFARPAHAAFWQAPASTTRQVVMINLQGGLDTLSLLHPAGVGTCPVNSSGLPTTQTPYCAYRNKRPLLAFDSGTSATLPLNGVSGWRWHPSAGPLAREFNLGKVAVIRKVGVPIDERSHFKSRNIMSLGRADLAARVDQRGWLGRLADAGLNNRFDILGVGSLQRPDFIANGANPLVIGRLAQIDSRVAGPIADHGLRRDILRRMTEQTFGSEARLLRELRPRVQPAFDAAVALRSATDPITTIGAYPDQSLETLGGSLPDIVKLIGSTLGTRIFYTFTDGFDTHGGQEGRVEAITRPNLTERLNLVMAALDAFITDLKAMGQWNDTLIVLFTEFGRRNAENQTLGTDHGRGFDAILLGGRVVGGLRGNPVTYSDIIGENLPVEIDFRTLFIKVLRDWLCLPAGQVATVFDDYQPLPGEPAFSFL